MEPGIEERRSARLVMSNGEILHGKLIGASVKSRGELVFTTSLVGYSESLSDPSYFAQILVYAYPLIGNYGVPQVRLHKNPLLRLGHESVKVHVAGVIVTVDSPEAFHWNSFVSLGQWLEKEGIPGMACVDTRHLIHQIREHGPLYGRIEPQGVSEERTYLGMSFGENDFFDASLYPILGEVSTKKPYTLLPHNYTSLDHVVTLKSRESSRKPSIANHNEDIGKRKSVACNLKQIDEAREGAEKGIGAEKKEGIKVAVVDCGVKSNILRALLSFGCEVEVLPWDSDLSQIDCHGWVLSNGPGDPMRACALIENVRHLLRGNRPILGICLGHQILGIAAGMTSERMRYGHRSHNQPVYLEGTSRGFITSQNHGFHLVEGMHWPDDWRVWFRNANDQSIEGIIHLRQPFRSVQFHPEACGGPRDTLWIIEDFVKELTSF
ncbi:MAG: glutamine-hydrolyzing carbamoyl-phosphate synthase small subunit [Proteobacteria bacterium]|nr:glutamine-hydrolyzing carbamoyl-phosphate synthase small subunit [Pseudomonadota bacterium]